jgi:tetratricopeptide (TPR) repeat protein
LSPKDNRHLLAAQGWLELGNLGEANTELENISPEMQSHPDVLGLRWGICALAQDWSGCVDIGKALTQLAPERPVSWIHLAYALHELKRTQEAFDVLAPMVQKFPTVETIPYNLACYTCQLGRLAEARDWLAQAIDLGNEKEIKLRALEDPDLAPLWVEEQAG